MIFIKDQLVIFCTLFVLYLLYVPIPFVVPVLVTIIICGMNTYIANKSNRAQFLKTIPILGFILYLLLCSLSLDYLFFLPLLIYGVTATKEERPLHLFFIFCLILFLCTDTYSIQEILTCLMVSYVCHMMKQNSYALSHLSQMHYNGKDELEHLATLLAEKNKALLEKQDSEIYMATLNERNRIAREIHDNVGHVLSRCLLQIGAVMTLTKNQNEVIHNHLSLVKESLSEAMTSIRSSVHNLHDESLDLEAEITKLVEQFNFCHIHFEYDINLTPSKEIKYSFIAIVKEALSNVIKHSHATQVEVLLREQPSFYQLIIRDNDLTNKPIFSNGIGLNNMQERVSQLGGQFWIDTKKGFRIFISVPKNKEMTYECSNY